MPSAAESTLNPSLFRRSVSVRIRPFSSSTSKYAFPITKLIITELIITSRRSRGGYLDRKPAPASRFAFDRYPSAVCLGDLLYQIQPQAVSADLCIDDFLCPIERIKNTAEIV